MPVGAQVTVEETSRSYYSVGRISTTIAEHLEWDFSNIWMPDHVFARLPRDHPEISNPIEAMAHVLVYPISVGIDDDPNFVRFLIEATAMRQAGFVSSKRMRFVDVIVELRHVDGEIIPRGYHLAPTRHGTRGRQLWQ